MLAHEVLARVNTSKWVQYRFRFGSAIREARRKAEHHEAAWGFLVAEGPQLVWLVNDPPRPARAAHCAAWVKSDRGRTGALVPIGDCHINIASTKPSTCISSLGNSVELRERSKYDI